MSIKHNIQEDSSSLFKAKIMVVDDSSLNITLILQYLKNEGFSQFETAQNGQEALQKIPLFEPDLLILDLLMPVMNGFEVIQTLKQNSDFRNIPIIVQTALSEPEQQILAWKNGANDIVTKPIHPLELISRVTNQLKTSFLMRELEKYNATAEEDIQHALELQLSLLPNDHLLEKINNQTNYKINSLFIPSRFLSGDLWGIQEINENEFGVWLCDFSGKGIRAAMNTFRLHTIINEFQHEVKKPGALLFKLNNRLKEFMASGQFSTFIYGIVNKKEESFIYASASFTPPLAYNPQTGSCLAGPSYGVPLGVAHNIEYDTHTLKFEKGNCLIFYSDLLWERNEVPHISLQDEDRDLFFKSLAPNKIIDETKKNIRPFMSFSDDLTLIEIS